MLLVVSFKKESLILSETVSFKAHFDVILIRFTRIILVNGGRHLKRKTLFFPLKPLVL